MGVNIARLGTHLRAVLGQYRKCTGLRRLLLAPADVVIE
jgi:hypothetical protein